MNRKLSIIIFIFLIASCGYLVYQVYSLNQQKKVLENDIVDTTSVLRNLNDQRTQFNTMYDLSLKIEDCQKKEDTACVKNLTDQWLTVAQQRDELDKQFQPLWDTMSTSAEQVKAIVK